MKHPPFSLQTKNIQDVSTALNRYYVFQLECNINSPFVSCLSEMRYFRVKPIASVQGKLKSETKQNNVVRENSTTVIDSTSAKPQHSKRNDSTENNNNIKRGLYQKSWRYRSHVQIFRQRKENMAKSLPHSPHTQIICKAILKLFCLKLKPISFNRAIAPLHLCECAGYVWNMHGRNSRTQTHLQLQTNPVPCVCHHVVLYKSRVLIC